MKLNQKLIKQLRNGEIAVENNGTLEQLREVLNAAFPEDKEMTIGFYRFYFMDSVRTNEWDSSYKTDLPIVPVGDFYESELFTGWAKDDNYPRWMMYFENDVPKYGFNSLVEWTEVRGGENYSECQDNRPATHEEIEKNLTQEAKRRGYKGGDTIKGFHRTTHKRPEIRSFRYDPEGDRLLTNVTCVVYEKGQWAEIVEQPKPNPIHYLVDGMEYSFNYQDLKAKYLEVVNYSDEQFMDNLPEIAHLACVVSFFKGLGNSATIGDKGVVHELIHLMTEPNEPTNNLAEIREKFNSLIKLV